MDRTMIDKREMLHIIREYVNSYGSQKWAAEELGISPQYLDDVLNLRRDISDDLSRKFGYARVSWFVDISGEQKEATNGPAN